MRPFSAMSRAARISAPQAARASAAPVEMRLTPRSSSSRRLRPGAPTTTLTGIRPATRTTSATSCAVFTPGANRTSAPADVGLEPPQRLREAAGVLPPDRLAAGSEQHSLAARVDRGAGGPEPVDRFIQRIERRVRPAGEILDREAGDAGANAELCALIKAFGVAGEAGLEIGVKRAVDRVGELAKVLQRISAGDAAIGKPGRKGHPRARGCERREAEGGEILRRADVERVRHHEAARGAVQFGEAAAFLGNRCHYAALSMRSDKRSLWRP